jgi:citrate lyase subunit beta/citryl-CoA lyase
MPHPAHPDDALFAGEKAFPVLPACEHFAGSEKLMLKALALMDTLGPVFNVTCDCEDGAPAGREREHAEMIARMLDGDANRLGLAGARIHDPTHAHWRADVDILLSTVGARLAYLTIPKCTSYDQAAGVVDYITGVAAKHGITRAIPLHILIETHGALRDVHRIATLPGLQVLDFGLMDFVSGHHGAIPASAMRSPGQFEHRLIARAKTEVVAAALANGVVPAHNVTLDLKNPYTTWQDARRARLEFGFLRQWSIHPSQIQPIVDAMKPEHGEVVTGAAILLAAQRADWGPIQHEGSLHDRATYRYYWEVLQKARVTGIPLPADAEAAFFGKPARR